MADEGFSIVEKTLRKISTGVELLQNRFGEYEKVLEKYDIVVFSDIEAKNFN